MRIDTRLRRVEERLDIGSQTPPFVLVLSAEEHAADAQYEARLQRRIDEAIRRRPNQKFILLL